MLSVWIYASLVFLLVAWTPLVVATFQLKRPRFIFGILLCVMFNLIFIILGLVFPSYYTTCFSIVYFFTGVFYETTGTFVCLHKAPMLQIGDYFHSIIPYRTAIHFPIIGEVTTKTLGDICMGIVFLPASFAFCFLGDHFVLLRRYLLLLGTTGFFRPITFCVTHMPDSCPESPTNQVEGVPPEELTLKNAMKHTLGFILNPLSFKTNGDMIFSGHTRFIVAGWCAMSTLVTPSNAYFTGPLLGLVLVLGLCGLLCFISSRLHYSVDIILAIFITISMWHIITALSEIAISSMDIHNQTVLMRLLISFFKWFNNSLVCNKHINSLHYSTHHLHYCTNPSDTVPAIPPHPKLQRLHSRSIKVWCNWCPNQWINEDRQFAPNTPH